MGDFIAGRVHHNLMPTATTDAGAHDAAIRAIGTVP